MSTGVHGWDVPLLEGDNLRRDGAGMPWRRARLLLPQYHLGKRRALKERVRFQLDPYVNRFVAFGRFVPWETEQRPIDIDPNDVCGFKAIRPPGMAY